MLEHEDSFIDRTAKFIKDKRMAMGESQEQLAIRAFGDKRKRPWISKIENGRPITLITLDKILKALNTEIDFVEK